MRFFYIITVMIILLSLNLLTYSNKYNNDHNKLINKYKIKLSSGKWINIISPDEIDKDWKNDFEPLIEKSLKNRKITDYLDGEKGFNKLEKGYWICIFKKSKNFRKIIENINHSHYNLLINAYLKIYFLQALILTTKNKIGSHLLKELNEIIQQISSNENIKNDITLIKNASVRHLILSYWPVLLKKKKLVNNKELSLLFKKLNFKAQKIIASIYVDFSYFNEQQAIKYYSKLLKNTYKFVLDYKNLEKNIEDIKSDNIYNNTKNIKNDIKNSIVKNYNNSELFLNTIFQLRNFILTSKMTKQKEIFMINLEKINIKKSLFQ